MASVRASLGAGTIAGGGSAGAGPACRIPRGRLAYQPWYRVLTWPLSGMCTKTRARNSSGSTVSMPAVGPSDLSDREVTVFAKRGDNLALCALWPFSRLWTTSITGVRHKPVSNL